MKGVEEDEVDLLRSGYLEFGEHVEYYKAAEAKGGCLVKGGECRDCPF
jgi:hypothetical protein